MRKIFSLALLYALSVGHLSAADEKCQIPDDGVLNSVVRIIGESLDGAKVQGSGVVVGENRIITAAHVVDDLRELRIRIAGNERTARILYAVPDRDLALLEATTSDTNAVKLSTTGLDVNDAVWAIGYPLGGNLTASEGLFVNKLNNFKLRTTAEVNHGQSGGGLISCNGGQFELSGMIISYGAVVRNGKYVRLPDYSVAVTTAEVSSLIHLLDPEFALTLATD